MHGAFWLMLLECQTYIICTILDMGDLVFTKRQTVVQVGLTAVCWATRKTRNAVCSKDKRNKPPTEMVCLISSLLSYSPGLQKEGAAL